MTVAIASHLRARSARSCVPSQLRHPLPLGYHVPPKCRYRPPPTKARRSCSHHTKYGGSRLPLYFAGSPPDGTSRELLRGAPTSLQASKTSRLLPGKEEMMTSLFSEPLPLRNVKWSKEFHHHATFFEVPPTSQDCDDSSGSKVSIRTSRRGWTQTLFS